jgi:predicted alpha/beta hydrolase
LRQKPILLLLWPIAAQAGYWKLMASPERYRVYAMLNFLGLPLTRSLGYMPGKAGLGMDLPKDAFLQWVGWVMSPRYLFDNVRLEALQNFPNYQGRVARADTLWGGAAEWIEAGE